MMKVTTLTRPELEEQSAQLYELAHKSGIVPTHIVAIATAGVFVAKAMCKVAPPQTQLLVAVSRRPTTSAKAKIKIRPLVAILPNWSTAILRRLELRFLTRHLSSKRDVWMSPDQVKELQEHDRRTMNIFVVDDCVDTGWTLKSVVDFLRGIVGNTCTIQSGSLAVSLEQPVMRPDFSLYQNKQVRGPWSYDSKG